MRRNGRIACLPKLQRDMVNRMLWNAVPYKNIVAALDEAGYTVNNRNISNWATGGYLEWQHAQEHVLQNRLNQDQLLDFLRRDDSPELSEVGLQVAATRLSHVLLQKTLQPDSSDLDLDKLSKLVELLCRLNRELATTQKTRDDSRRTLGPEYDPNLVKEEELISSIKNERFYSDPPPETGLPKPPVPPSLPPIPTASLTAEQALEEEDSDDADWRKHGVETSKALQIRFARASEQFSGTPAPTAPDAPHPSTNTPPQDPSHQSD